MIRLPLNEAEHFQNLLDKIDNFYVKTHRLKNVGRLLENKLEAELYHKIRNGWFQRIGFINQFIVHNSNLSFDDIQLLKSWQNAIRRKFIVVQYMPDFAIFYSDQDKMFYCVKALLDDFSTLLEKNPPVFIETRLFPYKDSIVWDELWTSSDQEIPAWFLHYINNELNIALEHNLLITQLNAEEFQYKKNT